MPIRLRLTLVFSAVAAVLVALGSWFFVWIVSSALLSSIDSQLTTAAGLASRYTTSVSTATATAGAPGLPGEYLLQVVDAAGHVQAASTEAGATPILGPSDLRRAQATRIATTIRLDEESTRVVAEPYAGHPGWSSVAAVSLEGYDHSVGDLETGAVIAGVALLVAAALGSFALSRRALAPVERMRRAVEMIAAHDDDSLIAVPGTRDELATLASTMNGLLARLRGALARERALVADASHELRTPLAVLSGELELASRPGRSAEELSTAVASAAEEVARLNRLTADLLLLARSDSGHIELQREAVDVALLLDRAAHAAGGRARDRSVRLKVIAPAGLGAFIDPGRVRQAVDNLVDNALRVAPPGSDIELRADAVPGRLVVEVLDRGPGFPPGFLPVAFERFRRPGANRGRDDGGSGLGLAIVRAVAAAHGGTAEASNRLDGGAAVRLEIPLPDDVPA